MSAPDFLIFILGLIFGSFAAALTWRYPRRISIKKGRSICPNCKKQIKWSDNIPLLSFAALKGRCRNCKKPISWRYPLIELSTAIGFTIIGHFATTLQGGSLNGISTLLFSLTIFVILLSIFVVDLENQVIPDSFVFFGTIVSVIYYLLSNFTFLLSNIFVGFTAASLMMLIHLITRGRGMGLGDVKFAFFGGLIVGPKLFLIWLLLAFLTGAVVGTILIIARKAHLKSQIAFGPFLILAIPLTLKYGEKILFWINPS